MLGGFSRGVRGSFPIVLGYLPISVTFGIVATQAGLPLWGAVLISAVMFSGASQFLLIAMLANSMPLALAFLLALTLNLRHVFYGPVLASLLKGVDRKKLCVVSFGLTDEVFAIASDKLGLLEKGSRCGWLCGLEFGAYGSWVAGTAVGAYGGAALLGFSAELVEVMGFALPALFLTLLLAAYKPGLNIGLVISFVVALSAAILGQAALGIVLAALAGALICVWGEQWKLVRS